MAKEIPHTSTAMWGEEHSSSTPANPASGPLGDPLAGEAGGKGEPPPPLPPDSPRIHEETEAIGVEELNVGRSADRPMFNSSKLFVCACVLCS